MEESKFNKDYKPDDEKDSLDEFTLELAQMIEHDEARPHVVVAERVEQVKTAYREVQRVIEGKKISITYGLHDPYPSSGWVSIIGKEITITNPALFAKIAETASNLEVCPKTDGTVQIDLGFDGLTRKVGN